MVKGFVEGAEKTVPWPSPKTTAYGLRVPSPIGGFVCLRALRETRGTGVAVAEETIGTATRELARMTGIDVCPEGGAAWAALDQLRQSGFIGERDRVVVFNTGTGLEISIACQGPAHLAPALSRNAQASTKLRVPR